MKRLLLFLLIVHLFYPLKAQQWISSNIITGTGNNLTDRLIADDLQNNYTCGIFTNDLQFMDQSISSNGGIDIFFAKYDDDQNEIWAKVIGGSGTDRDAVMTFSSDNQLLIAGGFSNECSFGAGKTLTSTNLQDLFLAKYNTLTGDLIWVKHIVSGTGTQTAYTIFVDPSGDILVGGKTDNDAYIGTPDHAIPAKSSFVIKFDSNGEYKDWHLSYSYSASANVYKISGILSLNDDYYIASMGQGSFSLLDNSGASTDITQAGMNDFFHLLKINKNGIFDSNSWIKKSTSSGKAQSLSVTIDTNDILCVGGFYAASDLAFDGQPLGLTNRGGNDIFLMTVDKDGNFIDSESISSAGREVLYGMKFRDDVLYVAGSVGGNVVFNHDLIPSSGTAMFVATYNIDDTGNIQTIGAVEGVKGSTTLATDMTISTNRFNLIGYFKSAELEIGDSIYTGLNPAYYNAYIAKACPIIAINDLEVKNVSGCDPLAKNGMISLDVAGSAGPYTYQWEKEGVGILTNQTSPTANNLDTGRYVVTVLYNDGFCSKEREFTITAPNSIAVSEITVTNADCDNPAIKGSFQVQVYNPAGQELQYKAIGYNYNESGLVEVYNKDWSSNGGSFTDCPAGRYIVSVRVGDDGCETNSQTIVAEKSSTGDLVGTIIKDYQCSIQNWPELVGEVSVEVTNTSTQQDWFALVDASTGATVQTTTAGRGRIEGQKCTFSEVAPGTYGFKAGIIGSSCLLVSENNLTMTVKPAIIVRSVKPQDVLCSGKPTGKITVSASGGVGTLSYKLLDKDDNDTNNTTGSTSGVFTGLSGGVYSVVAIDADLCTDTVPGIEIKDLNPELLLALDETYDACSGQSNAKIILKASGGLTNGALYTYTLSGNGGSVQNATGTFSGLSAANDYKAVVMEQTTKCKTELTNPIDVGQLQPITIGTHSATSVLCKGDNTGTITVSNITGGTNSGYTVSLLEKPGQTPNVDEGNYVFTGLSVGTYTIQITDDYGCASYDVAQSVGEPLLPLTVSATPAPADCYGYSTGSITAVGAGGTTSGTNPYKYELYHQGNLLVESQESGVFNDLPAGTAYVVKVTDANSCTADSDTKEITQPTAMTITTQTYDINCYGNTDGSIVVNATGGIGTKTYELCDKDGKPLHDNGTSPSFIGLAAGDYIVKVYLDNNCSQSTPVVAINQPAAALVMNSQVRNISCDASTDNGSITISATGGTAPYTYSLGSENSGAQTGEYTFSDLSAGTYSIGLVDSKGCAVVSETKEIAQAAAMKVEAVATEATCFGYKDGVITAVPERQESGLLYCLLLNGSQKSNWQSDPEFSNAKTAGLLEVNTPYAIRMKDSYDCVSESEVVEIIQPSAIVVSVESTGVSNTSSNDGTIKVTASGGVVSGQYQFQLTNESSTPIYEFEKHENPYTYVGLAIGKYSAQVKDDNGCVQTSTEITISVKTGVDDIVANSLKIYPNPSDGRFILQWESKKNMQVTVEIFNTSGKLVYKNKVSIGTGGVQTNVDISNQAKGTYILRVPELEINEKLVVQ